MNNYAVIKDEKVANVIVADELQVAMFFFPEDTVIEVTDETGQPAIGFAFDSEASKFVPGCYNSGWIFKRESWAWEPPVAYPQDGKFYEWNNESESWDEIELNPDAAVELSVVEEAPTE